MEEIITALLNLEVIGQVALLVLLTVQGLKVFGFVDGESAPKSAILSGLVFGVALSVSQLYTPAAVYISLFIEMYIGTMIAGLGYTYIVKPFLEKFGIGIASEDLS